LLNTQNKLISVSLKIRGGDDRIAIFNLLKEDKEAIEQELGSSLLWEEKPEMKSSTILVHNTEMDPNKRNTWEEQQQWLLEQLEKFREIFGPRIRKMDVGDWQPEDIETDDE
jgi:hypothetical protein